jgi:hypothetical protein
MNATLMYVGIGAVLATGVAILTIAVLFLQTARRYVDLTGSSCKKGKRSCSTSCSGRARLWSGKRSDARRPPRWSEILVDGSRAKNPLAAGGLKG